MRDKILGLKNYISVVKIISSVLLSVLRTGSYYCMLTGEGKNVSAAGLAGEFLLFFFIFFIVLILMDIFSSYISKQPDSENRRSDNKLVAFLSDKKYYLILAMVWLPFVIVKYPGGMCPDTWSMIYSYGNGIYSEWHSVFFTLVMGKLLDFGRFLGNFKIGFFIFSLIHYILQVLIFGYSFEVIKKITGVKWVQYVVLAVYLFNPYIFEFVGVIYKDTMYASFIFLFVLFLIEIALDGEKFRKEYFKLVLLALTVIGITLVRRNGVYIVIVTSVILLATSFIKKKRKVLPLFILAAAILSVLLFRGISLATNANKTSPREAFSFPFQQTARYLKEYGDDVTQWEHNAISGVLPIDVIADVYDPKISDPVKVFYTKNDKKLKVYLGAWVKMGLRHPDSYIRATGDMFYYLFVPEVDNIVISQDSRRQIENGNVTCIEEEMYLEVFDEKDLEPTAAQLKLTKFSYLLHSLPVFNQLGNVAVWTYVFLLILCFIWDHKSRGFLEMMPLIGTFGFVILGPAIYSHPRYMFPIIYSMAVMVIFVLVRKEKQ